MLKKIKIKKEREIRMFGIPLLQYGKKNNNGEEERYISLFPRRSFKARIFSRIFETLKRENIDFDDIYLCRMNMGETYVLSLLVKEWIKRNNSQKPIVILTNRYHSDIFDLFCSDVKYVYLPIPKAEMDGAIFEISNSYKEKRIFHWLPMQCNARLSESIKTRSSHFCDTLCNFAGVNLPAGKPDIETNCQTQEYIKKNEVNLENFVLICPEATSLEQLDSVFWKKMTQKLLNKGFDVICNCANPRQVPRGARHSFLSVKETYELAKHAKAIISLRSGMNDILSTIHTKQFIFYTALPYHAISALDCMKGYALGKLPFVEQDLIKEYNASQDQAAIIEHVVESIES